MTLGQTEFVEESDHTDDDEEELDRKARKRSHREMMEEGGFTVVQNVGNFMNSKRVKQTDKNDTSTMYGISQQEAQRIYREQLKRGNEPLLASMTEEGI